MKLLFNWIISALTILVSAYILPGVHVNTIWTAFVLAVVLGLINAVLRPILILLTLPINILSLGLFTLVINAGLVVLTAKIVPGFSVNNFWWALLFSIVLGLINIFFRKANH